MTDHRELIEEAAVYLTSTFARTGQARGPGSSLVARLADALAAALDDAREYRDKYSRELARNGEIYEQNQADSVELLDRAISAERRVAELEQKVEETRAWAIDLAQDAAAESRRASEAEVANLAGDLAAAEARARSYEDGLTWQTTCTNCAGLLGQNYAQYCELEALHIELDEEREKTARDSAAEADIDRLEAERDDWKWIVDQNLDASAETVAEMETKLAEENIAWLKLDGRWARAIRWAWRWRKVARQFDGAADRVNAAWADEWAKESHKLNSRLSEASDQNATLARALAAAEGPEDMESSVSALEGPL